MSKSACAGIAPCHRGGCSRGKVCGNKNRCITIGKGVWNQVCSGHHPASPKASKPSKPSGPPPRRRACDHTTVCQTAPCPPHRDGRHRACSIKGNCVLHGGAAWKKSGCGSPKPFSAPPPPFKPSGPFSAPPPPFKPPKKHREDRLRAGWYARQYPDPWGDRCDVRNDGSYKCLLQRRNASPYWASPSKSGAGQEACEDWSPRCQDPDHA